MHLFWRKGFSATSLSDLTSTTGVAPPSLYAAFGSKEALYGATLQHYIQTHGSQAWVAFDAAPTAREAFTAFLMTSAAIFSRPEGSDRPAGCMLALSAVGDEGNEVLGAVVRNARAQTLERLRDRLTPAVAAGAMSAEEAMARARFVLAVQGGMALQARDGASREELEQIVRQASRIWDADA